MKTKFWNHILAVGLIMTAIALTGCGTPAAKDFHGRWKPVNHFRNQPTEIPLVAAYTFYATPMDETLKGMLTRWASDSGRELSYQLPFDVTLYTPVSGIRTTDIDSAAQQLTIIYSAQHAYVSATDRKILVRPSSTVSGPDDTENASAMPAPAKPADSK